MLDRLYIFIESFNALDFFGALLLALLTIRAPIFSKNSSVSGPLRRRCNSRVALINAPNCVRSGRYPISARPSPITYFLRRHHFLHKAFVEVRSFKSSVSFDGHNFVSAAVQRNQIVYGYSYVSVNPKLVRFGCYASAQGAKK